jgi:hypothetical protein
MYSWKAIRIASTILLLLPVIHLAYLLSRDTLETLDNSPATWAREIANYAAADSGTHLPENPIVVVGGLRVKLWPGLADLLTPQPVLMRGLGDAIVEDLSFNYTRLIGFYQPATVVLLPGNSEFHIRDHKTPQELVAAIRELVALDASYGITRYFYIFTPVKTILFPKDYPTIEESTRLLRSWAKADSRVVILDANTTLGGPDGRPLGRYFRADGVNLNEHGYLRLSDVLRAQLIADAAGLHEHSRAP